MTSFLDIACNPLRSPEERREAWENSSVEFWYRSHTEGALKGLPLTVLPPEYRDRVFELVKAQNRPIGAISAAKSE